MTVAIPKTKITLTEIDLEHKVLSEVAAAAEALGLSTIELCTSTGIALLNAMSIKQFQRPLQEITCQPEDYAQSMQVLLLEVKDRAIEVEKKLVIEIEDNEKAAVKVVPEIDEDEESKVDDSAENSGTESEEFLSGLVTIGRVRDQTEVATSGKAESTLVEDS